MAKFGIASALGAEERISNAVFSDLKDDFK